VPHPEAIGRAAPPKDDARSVSAPGVLGSPRRSPRLRHADDDQTYEHPVVDPQFRHL
jgi:hypothetical protein